MMRSAKEIANDHYARLAKKRHPQLPSAASYVLAGQREALKPSNPCPVNCCTRTFTCAACQVERRRVLEGSDEHHRTVTTFHHTASPIIKEPSDD